jgi:6-phosphofructokinase
VLFNGGGPAPGSMIVVATLINYLLKLDWHPIWLMMGLQAPLDLLAREETPQKLIAGVHYHEFGPGYVTPGRVLDLMTTSRANPGGKEFTAESFSEPKRCRELEIVLEVIEYLGAGILVGVGGDDTLTVLNRFLNLLSVVFCPKTMDNDLILSADPARLHVGNTFGFSTSARLISESVVRAYLDAAQENTWIFLECLGRTCGSLALAAANKARTVIGPRVLVYSAEMLRDNEREKNQRGFDLFCQRLARDIITMEDHGFPKGVCVVSENIGDYFKKALNPEAPVDTHGQTTLYALETVARIEREVWRIYQAMRASQVRPVDHVTQILKFRHTSENWTTRAVLPGDMSQGDALLCELLGRGAASCVDQGKFGVMVRPTSDSGWVTEPIASLIDPSTYRAVKRLADPDLVAAAEAGNALTLSDGRPGLV